MKSEHLLTVATIWALLLAVGATLALVRASRRPSWLTVFYLTASLALVVLPWIWTSSFVNLGRNSVEYLVKLLASGDIQHTYAAGFGICVGFGAWQSRFYYDTQETWQKLVKAAGVSSVLLGFVLVSLLAVQKQIKPYVQRRGLASILVNPVGYTQPPEFILEKLHDCDFHPLQIAVGPQGDLFATGYSGVAFQHGIVARISQDPNTGRTTERVVARNLSRPHGLAFMGDDLYVSRSGQHARAVSGALVSVNTGAVTLLRDLDGDGIMDYYHDVLADLPGAQGADTLHQNNGIAFDHEGYLYTTVGAHSDRLPTTGKFEGTILRSRLDGSELTVFASGFRNPFDLAMGPDHELFCTDNDASDRQNGDELNHVVADRHYGFPYADGKEPHPQGTTPPILVTTQGTYQGLCYTTCPKLPEPYKDCLYVVNYGKGEIYRVRLDRKDDTYGANSSLFAQIPGALDVTVDCEGTFYVNCFHKKAIYRIRLRDAKQ